MTYSGPPCQAEIQRNNKRKGNGHVDQTQTQIVFGHPQQNYAHPYTKTDYHQESRKSVKMEFTPPRSKRSSGKKPKLSPHRFQQPVEDYPMQIREGRPINVVMRRGDQGYQQPPLAQSPHYENVAPRWKPKPERPARDKYAHAQSKIKDHVAYFKNMSKNRKNRDLFSKDPQIFAKPHPSEKHFDPAIDSNSFVAKAAPLRRKSQNASQRELEPHPLEGDTADVVIQDTRTTGFYKPQGMSPSGVTSGLSERDQAQPKVSCKSSK